MSWPVHCTASSKLISESCSLSGSHGRRRLFRRQTHRLHNNECVECNMERARTLFSIMLHFDCNDGFFAPNCTKQERVKFSYRRHKAHPKTQQHLHLSSTHLRWVRWSAQRPLMFHIYRYCGGCANYFHFEGNVVASFGFIVTVLSALYLDPKIIHYFVSKAPHMGRCIKASLQVALLLRHGSYIP